jgi:hypothetical protein
MSFSAFISMITELLVFPDTRALVTFKWVVAWVHMCFCSIKTSISRKSLQSSLYRLQQVSVALWKSFYRQFFISTWLMTLQLWCHVYLCSFMLAGTAIHDIGCKGSRQEEKDLLLVSQSILNSCFSTYKYRTPHITDVLWWKFSFGPDI